MAWTPAARLAAAAARRLLAQGKRVMPKTFVSFNHKTNNYRVEVVSSAGKLHKTSAYSHSGAYVNARHLRLNLRASAAKVKRRISTKSKGRPPRFR